VKDIVDVGVREKKGGERAETFPKGQPFPPSSKEGGKLFYG